MSRGRASLLLAMLIGLMAIPSLADSQARVVRLSEVQGDVQIDRNTGQDYEKAYVNLPVTQGAKLQTKKDARAEVEFEDGSTLRITPDTVVEFAQLSLRDSGGKVSIIHVQEGTAYVRYAGTKGDEFSLTFGQETATPARASHLRLVMGDTDARLAVFKGEVQVAGGSTAVKVKRYQTATFDLADKDRHTIAEKLESDPYDEWDREQDHYQQQYASSSYSSYSPYAYGTSDLNYYGSFFDSPGYGTLWQPYFAGAGWDPFMNGMWSFYPGFGYGWVSSYPWGWTPYHYGSWVFLPGNGWAWQPGGSWAGWNTPRVTNPPATFQIPQPPGSTGMGTVAVNRGPLPATMGTSNRLMIANDSAGLGIPRGGVKNLGQLSQNVRQTGSATARLHTAPVGTSPSWRSAPVGSGGPARSSSSGWHGGTASGHSAAGVHAGGGAHR